MLRRSKKILAVLVGQLPCFHIRYYKSSYVKYISIENCLTGSNGGFLDDDTHYNNATLKKILTRFKKMA